MHDLVSREVIERDGIPRPAPARSIRRIRRLHRDSKYTVVLIEHDMRVVFHLADRISVLAEGKLLAEGTPEEIRVNEHVQNAYLGKAE